MIVYTLSYKNNQLALNSVDKIDKYLENKYIIQPELELRRKKEEEEKIRLEEANRLKAIEDAKLLQEKETGKKIVRLTAVFEIEVNADLDDMKVLTKYKDKLASEYTTLKSVAKV